MLKTFALLVTMTMCAACGLTVEPDESSDAGPDREASDATLACGADNVPAQDTCGAGLTHCPKRGQPGCFICRTLSDTQTCSDPE